MTNLIHGVLALAYFGVLITIAGNVRVGRLRNFSSLIQLTVVLTCVDLLIGFFLVERAFDASRSAAWITKSIYMAPILLGGSVWWMLRAHKKASAKRDDANRQA